MAHFHGICHGKFALRYVGGVPEVKKLDFSGLKGQFDVKNAHFWGANKLNRYFEATFWLLEPTCDPFS